MMGFVYLLVIALVFAVIWNYLAKRPGPRAKIGPDGTNVRNPESFVVHHEGKGQGLDIANTALKERTENLKSDLPGDATQIKAPVPGRDMVRMDAPPSDVSKYGDEKVAPGATPGQPGARPKADLLTKGPGDVELAEEVLPFGHASMDRSRPAQPGGEGRPSAPSRRTVGPEDEPDFPVEQPELEDELTDLPNGAMPARQVTFQSEFEVGEEMISFQPDPQTGWMALQGEESLPADYADESVTAIVRNPRSLYVYWERSSSAVRRLQEMLGETAFRATRPCLRVFDVATEGSFTVDVGEQDDHWFVNDLEPGHRYVVSFERRTDEGRYYLVGLSDPVSTPAETAQGTGLLYDQLANMTGDRATSPSSPWR